MGHALYDSCREADMTAKLVKVLIMVIDSFQE